jgi:DNA segregation ATPase FtsK/SpoIIIE-like protein
VATNRPDQARITLVDPKQGVDYFAFEGLPHLDGGIIDQQEEALARIQRLVNEMDARYGRMRHARATNLRQYNMRVEPSERLPMLWLIHDEFADWMLTEEYNPTTLFNRGSRAGAFFYARDRPGDYAVAGQPPIARCPPAGRL